MQVYGFLEKAQLENTSSDLSNTLAGLIWFNTTDDEVRYYDGSAVRTVANLDKAQTFTNKTITGGVFDQLNLTEQGSTPSTPSAGTKKLYAKDDGKVYTLDSNGSEIEVGSGSGGGSINFDDKGDMEAAQASDFTVSAGTLSFTSTVSEVGRGAKSFKFVPAASGDTVERSSLPVPLGYRQNGKMFASGTIKCAQDVIIRLKDKTSAVTFLEETIPANAAYTPFEFSDSHRIDIENVSWEIESTGTGDILIDDIAVSPFGNLFKAELNNATDWETFSPNFSNDTGIGFTTNHAIKRRDGAELIVFMEVSATGSGSSASTLLFNLPDSLSARSDLGVAEGVAVGSGFFKDETGASGQKRYSITGLVGANKSQVLFQATAGTGAPSSVDIISGTDVANTDRILISLRIPIQGWQATSSKVVTNSDSVLPSRVIGNDSGVALAPSTLTFIGWNTSIHDDDGRMLSVGAGNSTTYTSTTRYEVLKSGYYFINSAIVSQDNDLDANNSFEIYIYKNGAVYASMLQDVEATLTGPILCRKVSSGGYFQKGDIISIAGRTTSAGNVNLLDSDETRSWFEVFRVDKSPITGLGNETCYIKDVSSDEGGSSVAGYNTRRLNTIQGSTSFASLSSNQFTLQPGTYDLNGSAPCFRGDRHRLRIYNITDAAYESDLDGDSILEQNTNNNSRAHFDGILTITEAKTFELRHAIQTARASDGLGPSVNLSISGGGGDHPTVFARIKIVKLK